MTRIMFVNKLCKQTSCTFSVPERGFSFYHFQRFTRFLLFKMLINEHTEVAGPRVVLVPYDENLVPRYHEWMKSSELLAATASEPLSLEEEYAMQKSWRQDSDKLTFIVLDACVRSGEDVSAMIGDTNLFLLEPKVAEVMIMIAEESYRRKGYGKEALILILRYGIEVLGIERYEARIGRGNEASIKMFEGFGFEKVAESEVFDEVTLVCAVTSEWRDRLSSQKYVVRYVEQPKNRFLNLTN